MSEGLYYQDGVGLYNQIRQMWYKDGATTRELAELWYGDGVTARLVWVSSVVFPGPGPILAATASPASPYGSRSTSGSVATNVATATATGYTGALTYAWEFVSGDASITVSSASSQSVTFSGNVGPVNVTRSAVWKCKVTDSTGFVYTNTISPTVEYTGP
jgi:hypothetical protein